MKLLLPTLLLLLSSATAFAQQEQLDTDRPRELKILAWNVYMLPKFAPMQGRVKRAYMIADTLRKSDFDILVLEETFHPVARKVLCDSLRAAYPFQYGPANMPKTKLRANSGVMVFSKFKLDSLGTIEYRDKRGADAFAKKGALMLEGTWRGKKFQLIGTHMQAEGAHEIRAKQMRQMRDELLLKFQRDSVPQIICGDMNVIRQTNDRYEEMLRILEAEDSSFCGALQCTYDYEKNDQVVGSFPFPRVQYDYAVIRKNNSRARIINREVNVYQKACKIGTKHCLDLSDHYGIRFSVRL